MWVWNSQSHDRISYNLKLFLWYGFLPKKQIFLHFFFDFAPLLPYTSHHYESQAQNPTQAATTDYCQ